MLRVGVLRGAAGTSALRAAVLGASAGAGSPLAQGARGAAAGVGVRYLHARGPLLQEAVQEVGDSTLSLDNTASALKKKSSKASGLEADFEGLPIPDELQDTLKKKGFKKLFDVQKECFTPGFEGKDIVARSRTGTGKTIAFGLPIVARFLENPTRVPSMCSRAIIMCPTRELAKQVEAEISGLSPKLRTAACYGGAAFGPQAQAIRQGLDVLVGTPGRVVDHLTRGSLSLNATEICVLDEADEMLKIGFTEQLNEIMSRLPKSKQTLLFSATVPNWVKSMARQSMQSPIMLDLVGEEKMKCPETVKHIGVCVSPWARDLILADLISVHGRSNNSRTIVFVPTKREASELASIDGLKNIAVELHGDISQAGREIALAGFRSGRYKVLVATDVAARGIDIPSVDTIIQTVFPNEKRGGADVYIHRAGRTGRAGKSGTSIILYTPNDARLLARLEQEVGVTFERSSPPSIDAVMKAGAEQAVTRLAETSSEVAKPFMSIAKKFVDENNFTLKDKKVSDKFEETWAKCLAIISGHTKPVIARSALSHKENFTAVLIKCPNHMPESDVRGLIMKSVGNIDELPRIGRVVSYSGGAVADIDNNMKEKIMNGLKE
eukprot:CAMPEP_0198734568 /NCGR_PEP_ID=MMETSP1475-20131203/53658_1 /TAXON_ID= ORGANISM="Unidentified sp., Strain CCMP1999" /NCGR_SAMPLE_ID=MMETSP1475 /ASSEMBLY_ACC=CAM_ASM_001111 /LENGTH=608 /DNA_ID=CAMNT_0044498069 /DNA_START=112 /DNA_END=1935 /DNA_ORIENTATION=+